MRIKNLFNAVLKKIRPQSEVIFNQKQSRKQTHDKVCFFTHVPKTGGTSFIVFLDRFFPSQSIHQPQLWWEVGDLKEVRNKNFDLFRGHLGGQTGELLSTKEINYITLVRDPVKLAYSTYQFVKRVKETALHELVTKDNMSFETFLAHPKTQHLVTNRLIHNLCYGYGVNKEQFDYPINDQNFNDFRKTLGKSMQSISEEEKLQLACQFLNNCLWVGVLEDFDHAVRLLCYKMSWPPIGQSQKLNIHKKPPEISDEAYELAQKLNKNDMALYQLAKEKYNDELKEMFLDLGVNQDDPSNVLDDAVDRYYQQNHPSTQKEAHLDEVNFNCSNVLFGSQWHRREWSEIDQQYFRWSGPGTDASLDFWVKRQAYQVKVKIMDAIGTQFLDGVSLSINGNDVEFECQGKGRSRLLTFSVTKNDVLNNGLLRLAFHCQELKPHHEVFGFDDERLVGLALSQIDIKAV